MENKGLEISGMLVNIFEIHEIPNQLWKREKHPDRYLVSCMDQGHTLHSEHGGGGANPQFVIPPWAAINQYLPPFRGGSCLHTCHIRVLICIILTVCATYTCSCNCWVTPALISTANMRRAFESYGCAQSINGASMEQQTHTRGGV